MIFKRIALNNAGPFLAEWEVLLPEGPTVVVGEYEESGVRSNRAGKSYFAVDAPLYALFGKFRGSRLEEFPHRLALGREESWVETDVESSDGRDWSIRRGRTPSGDPIRLLNGSHVSEADLLRTVEREILGLTADEYLMTCAFVQGEMHAFMKATPAEKRRVVSPWFRTDRWIPRADLAGKRLRAAQAQLRELEAREIRLRRVLDSEGEFRAAVADSEKLVKRTRLQVDTLAAELAAEKAKLELAVKERGRRADLRREVARLEEEVKRERAEAEGELQNRDLAFTRAKEALQEARGRKDRLDRLQEEEARLRDLRAELAQIREDLLGVRRERDERSSLRKALLEKFRELERTRTGVCPVLREACDRVAPDAAVLEEVKREGLTARRALTGLEERIVSLEWKAEMGLEDVRLVEEGVRALEELKDLPTLAETERGFEAAKRALEDAEAAVKRVKLARTETARALTRARRDLEKFPEVGPGAEEAVAEKATALQTVRQELTGWEEDLAAARASVAELERAAAELEKLEDERGMVRDRISKLAWSSYAFGAAGIPSRELENAFGLAEDSMNQVLEDLGTALRVQFAPTRELKDWEAACLACGAPFEKGERTHRCRECGTPRRRRRRDELRLEVADGGNASSFELDSGGGKVLLSLGVRLGLARLPGESRAVRCEHLLIDEPDGALDEVNRAALHDLLRRRLPDLGIRQALLITHADVRREFSSVVNVHRWEDEDRSAVWRDA